MYDFSGRTWWHGQSTNNRASCSVLIRSFTHQSSKATTLESINKRPSVRGNGWHREHHSTHAVIYLGFTHPMAAAAVGGRYRQQVLHTHLSWVPGEPSQQLATHISSLQQYTATSSAWHHSSAVHALDTADNCCEASSAQHDMANQNSTHAAAQRPAPPLTT